MITPSFIVSEYASVGILLEEGDKGRWKAICPFHKETAASFIVFPDGGYHCFGCRKHGKLPDILEYFGLDGTFSLTKIDVTAIANTSFSRLGALRASLEADLIRLLCDKPFATQCKIYDSVDALFIEVKGLKFTNQLKLAVFIKQRYAAIRKKLQSRD